jgi:hypothetical protein
VDAASPMQPIEIVMKRATFPGVWDLGLPLRVSMVLNSYLGCWRVHGRLAGAGVAWWSVT